MAGDIPRFLRCLFALNRGTAAVTRDAQSILYGSAVLVLHVGRRRADLLLSQMHLSHSGLGSCDDVTITARRAVSSTRSLLTPFVIPYKQKVKRFSKQEAAITANCTYILGHQLLGSGF